MALTPEADPLSLVVDGEGRLPLPWLAGPVAKALAGGQGHALLLHGSAGAGTLALAAVVAQSSLCESPAGHGLACGRCGSCRLVQARLHPDLAMVLPEMLRREQGWPAAGDRPDGDDAKRKPGRQIRVEQLRGLAEWTSRTAARDRGKVAVLHPAEAMNTVSASALLKTLEEPPAGTRLLLTCADPAALLPTVRSRCQLIRFPGPRIEEALVWLRGRGIEDAGILLAGCAGQPLAVLALAAEGIDAARWSALPAAVAEGRMDAVSGWPAARVVDALQKLCHDALASSLGGSARFFPATGIPKAADRARLLAWWRELQRIARHVDHPWQEGLLLESLLAAAAHALAQTPVGVERRRRPAATLNR